MKVLAFTDSHGDRRAIKEIVKKSRLVDVVVCAGDLSNFSTDLEILLKQLSKIEKPLLIIHGNHELDTELRKLCKKYGFIFMHKNQYKIDNYLFVGFGGGGFSKIDKEFEDWSKNIRKKRDEIMILITHAPVHNTKLDFLSRIGHVGNISIRKFIEKKNPELTICGHFHENFGVVDKVKQTKIINPGKYGKIIKI
ncbi:metallophosphoesterase family protein [Candidatus Woesearchaeota archaeon]|nr:metallophosphoesterase family protein [Candidatus Woesearchaeota archaeon]